MNSAFPSVYGYSDFRKYLRDCYLAAKRADERYSYATFARQAGCASANYLKLVMDGTRNLTVANIHRFAAALGLRGQELDYFEALVLLGQSKGRRERAYYEARTARLRPEGVARSRGARRKPDELFSHWYYPAILVTLADQPANLPPSEVAERVGVPEEVARSAMEWLVRSGRIAVREGRYRLDFAAADYRDSKGMDLRQREFLHSQILLSERRFRSGYPKGGKFQSHTFTLPPDALEENNARIHEFIQGQIEQASRLPSRDVVQLNVQFFALKGPQ